MWQSIDESSAQNEASFISVAGTIDTARKLIDRSPLSFYFAAEPFDGLSPTTTLFNSRESGVASPVNPIDSTTAADNPRLNKSTRFTVHVFPSEGYKHKTVIRYSPLHGPWPKDQGKKETFVYSALKKVVPERMFAHDAFCDWHTGGQLSNDARHMRNQSRTGKLAHIHERIMRRKQAKGPDNILLQLKSLRQPGQTPTTPTASQDGEE